jgi:ABC-type transport system involved in multi-copper enzyme maturation permease subunit
MRKTGNGITFNKTLSLWQIVNGKFLGALLLIVLAIIPTFIYESNLQPSMPGNSMGSTIGSYAGLMLLISAYSSIFSRQPYPIIKSWLLSSPYFCVSFLFWI